MNAVETYGLTERYGDLVAVDMQVRSGEVYGWLAAPARMRLQTVLPGHMLPTSRHRSRTSSELR